jgi:hypothetical protein
MPMTGWVSSGGLLWVLGGGMWERRRLLVTGLSYSPQSTTYRSLNFFILSRSVSR